ncbi:unnamed protein product [Didymodactylos carnosus]|uniref:C2H2-type domain-containing protein n=1 Tax=Didymodactylos carnosus TaxID=1234261 RepID=A0A814ENN4_9BILA|nr:unnamed protein product [Didymodactylos carnosus]CAF1154523.1 unnamed protein product [Didymodactylos carnosus]CAF3741893.1 unnamed protein product [Didymodactylos carnosus]CAF3964694.1 unnamed protein product [Didymodactylos carnosus]
MSAELKLPPFLTFKPSKAKTGENGLYAKQVILPNEPLGIYKGKIRRTLLQTADEEYVWAILSARGVPVFYVDASNPTDGNFLRYIRWTHDKQQQNVVCMQQNQQIHYFSLKTIRPDEELLTFIERQKTKKKDVCISLSDKQNGRTRRHSQQQQLQHHDNADIKIIDLNEFKDENLIMNRSTEFELQITRKFLSETILTDGLKHTCLKCDICHQIFMSNVAFKFHYHNYHITPHHLSYANRPRIKVRDNCNICKIGSVSNDVKSVVVDLIEVVCGDDRLPIEPTDDLRFIRLHLYRCYWCAPTADCHYNTAKQLAQHMRSKHFRLLQALLTTSQTAALTNNSKINKSKTKHSQDQQQGEQNENGIDILNITSKNEQSTLSRQTSRDDTTAGGTSRGRGRPSSVMNGSETPISFGIPDPLTERDCQQLFSIGEQVAYNMMNCIDGTLEDIQQNEELCRKYMDIDDSESLPTSLELFLEQFQHVCEYLGPKKKTETAVQVLANSYFKHNPCTSSNYNKTKITRKNTIDRFLCPTCDQCFHNTQQLIEHEKEEHDRLVSVYDWGCEVYGVNQANPYAFILELENHLDHSQKISNKPSTTKIITRKSVSKSVKKEFFRSNTCPLNINSCDIKPKEEQIDFNEQQRKSKRLQNSMINNPSSINSLPTTAINIPQVDVKKEADIDLTTITEQVNSMKRMSSRNNNNSTSIANNDTSSNDQVIVKTDKRYYWCTKCSKLYLNLISLYTESHYRQCVRSEQHFTVVNDPLFFQSTEMKDLLPANDNKYLAIVPTVKLQETTPGNKTVPSEQTSSHIRTYFLNGRPVGQSRPITVKDLRQQFLTHSTSTLKQTPSIPSEEYIYHPKVEKEESPPRIINSKTRMSNGIRELRPRTSLIDTQKSLPLWRPPTTSPPPPPSVILIPTSSSSSNLSHRSLDRFRVSSDEEDQISTTATTTPVIEKSQTKEVEKTFVRKRRSPTPVLVKEEISDEEGNEPKQRKKFKRTISNRNLILKRRKQNRTTLSSSYSTSDVSASKNSTSSVLKRSISQTIGETKRRRLFAVKSTVNNNNRNQSSDSLTSLPSNLTNLSTRSNIPEALQCYAHVCVKCNMPFSDALSLDLHQKTQCLERNVLDECGMWFRCPLCSLTYCDATLMSLHITKTHRSELKSIQTLKRTLPRPGRKTTSDDSTSDSPPSARVIVPPLSPNFQRKKQRTI